MSLRSFVSIPKDLREWDIWMVEQTVGGNNSVQTNTIQAEAVTYAKIQDVTADRILGRLATAGVVSELTAAQLVTLLEAEGWTFAAAVQFSGNVGFYGTTPIAQPANITAATTGHALNATFSDTQVEAALNALGTKINQVLTTLDNLGLTA